MRWLGFAMRWLISALGATLAIGALYWLYRDLDFDRFVTGLATAEPYTKER